MFSGAGYALETSDMQIFDPADIIFRSSLENMVHDEENNFEGYNDKKEFQEIDPPNMPFFKQIRLRLTNKYLDVTTRSEYANENGYNYTPKWKFWNKNRGQYTPIPKDETEKAEEFDELKETISEETASDIADLSFESGINTEVTEKQLMLDSDNINFDEETGDMIATGRPVLTLPPQNTTVIADKMTYNDEGNILKGIGNVLVLKDGKPMKGDYLEIDMNEESMFVDNPISEANGINVKAKNAMQKDGVVILNNGSLYSEKSSISRIASSMVGPRFEDMIVRPEEQNLFFGNPEGNNLTMHVDKIEIDARKNHDIIKVKNIKFYHKDKYFFRWPGFTAYTNKQHSYFEGNYPEFGSIPKLGMYAGPGFVFSGPAGSVIKVVPFLNYKNKIGIGGMIKYVNTHNRTELGYGSANDIFFLRGIQRLDDDLHLHYAANAYTDEWFLGGRMAKYMTEIYYDKFYRKKDFLAKGLPLEFRHRIGFGLMKDDDKEYNSEKFDNASGMSTTRTRYMAQITQSLYNYRNTEKKIALNVSFIMQGSAALYGTGDTQFVGRVGPSISSQYKNWMQTVSYYMSAYQDQSPMPRYDAYRYGRQSVHVTEAFRISKYVSVGWSGYFNLSDDSPNSRVFQENAFLVSLGPDDFKVILGYDFIRERTYFGINVAFDPKGTKVNYDKMIIKNPELLGTQDETETYERQVAFAPTKEEQYQRETGLFNKNTTPQVLKYAQVIEIEDPDKEKID